MSLRRRILLLAAAASVLGAVVVALGYWYLAEQQKHVEKLKVDVEAAKRIEGIKVNLQKTRYKEALLFEFPDETTLESAREHVALMRDFANQALTLTADKLLQDKYRRLLTGIGRYEAALEDLGNLLLTEASELEELRNSFDVESTALLSVLERSVDELRAALGSGRLPPGEMPRIASRAIEELARMDLALRRFRDDEGFGDAAAVRSAAGALAGLLADARASGAGPSLLEPLERAVEEGEAVVVRVNGFTDRLGGTDADRIRLAERTALDFAGLESTTADISTAQWAAVEAAHLHAQRELSRGKGLLAGFILIAFALTMFLAWQIASRVGRRLTALQEAATRVLKARVVPELEETPDELGAVAHSLNRLMKDYLELRTEHSRLGVQEAVLEIVQVVSSTVRIRDLLEKALHVVMEVTETPVAGLYILDGNTGRLVLASVVGAERSAFKENGLLPGEGIIGRAAQMERAWVLDRVPQAVSPSIQTPFGDVLPTCLVYQPIRYEGRSIGVLALARTESADARLRTILEIVSGSLGIAIANASAHEKLEIRVAERTEELRSVNTELAQKNVKLTELARLKSEFLSNMTHELRTPLNVIIGYTEMVLAKTPELPTKRRSALEKVLRNSRELLSLINSILDLSKHEAERIDVYIEEFDPRELVKESVSNARQLLQGKKVSVEGEYVGPDGPIRQDRLKVLQCVGNLLSNAVKFTAEGTISLRFNVDEERVLIQVADTGIGIRQGDREKIFEEFRQSDGSIARKYGGTGLGLAITRKNVELLGGSIDVVSKVGEGSIFTIILPHPKEDEPAAPTAALPGADANATLNPPAEA